MHRSTFFPLLAVLLSGAVLIGAGRFAAAQDPGPVEHPAQGSWSITTDPADLEFSPRLATFGADGSVVVISGYQITGVGRWEPTGATTATVTYTVVTNGPAQVVFRVAIEVAPDGATFTGTFTNEFAFDPAGGGTSGEIGPGTIGGTRLLAEAPGTPTSSFEAFFPPAEGTPAATPDA